MSNEGSESPSPDDESPSPDAVYEVMEPFEPYTIDDLLEQLNVTKGQLWSFLRKLHQTGKIRKKESEPNQRIWVREPPTHECSNCDYEFQVKHLHPIFGSLQFCPRCGTSLR